MGNNSVEFLDLRSGRVLKSLLGIREPQGVWYDEARRRLYVSSGGVGTCVVVEGTSLTKLAEVAVGRDADNLHGDADGDHLIVSAGDGLGALPLGGGPPSRLIDLPGHVEGFAVSAADQRLFANVPEAGGRVFVVDRRGGRRIEAWDLGAGGTPDLGNFPLALDERGGRILADLALDADPDPDPDDLFVDAARGRIYVSCGSGYVDIVAVGQEGHYAILARVATPPGGRTSLWRAAADRLIVAIPADRGREARILVLAPASGLGRPVYGSEAVSR